MKKSSSVAFAFLLTLFCPAQVAGQDTNLVVNGGFEASLKGWRSTGAVHLEKNSPLAGKASAIIGPGVGSLTQRIKTGSGNALTVSAIIQSQRTNGWVIAVHFLDKRGRELMRVDSVNDMNPDKHTVQ